MKFYFLVALYFTCMTLDAQDDQVVQTWVKAKNAHQAVFQKIRDGEDWDSILASLDTSQLREYSADIDQTIRFLKSPRLNAVDSFFHEICMQWYQDFPFRVSGQRMEELYNLHDKEPSSLYLAPGKAYSNTLFIQASQIIHKPPAETIPLLIKYLDNHGATRLTLEPFDWDDPWRYLRISDMSKELLKMITWCDFFSVRDMNDDLYSGLPPAEQKKIKDKITGWHIATRDLTQHDAALYFLDSKWNDSYSHVYTSDHLLFHGDTLSAMKYYQKYYELMEVPCRVEEYVGKKLLSLGDRRVLVDCASKIMNYSCYANNGIKCVALLLEAGYPYADNILGEVVATEPHSIYRQQRTSSAFVWPHILASLGAHQKNKMPVTIMAFMNMQDELNTIGETPLIPWKKKYSDRILEGFRICDLALLKYHDTIKPVAIQNWSDKNERDASIRTIQENEKKMQK